MKYYHGGAPGLRPGNIIEPATGTAHLVDGCPTCEARRNGHPLPEDDNDLTLVYITTERDYAAIYAAGYPRGALYRVEPVGPLVDRSTHDPAPSWGCQRARVLAVVDPLVTLTPKRLRSLMRKYAG